MRIQILRKQAAMLSFHWITLELIPCSDTFIYYPLLISCLILLGIVVYSFTIMSQLKWNLIFVFLISYRYYLFTIIMIVVYFCLIVEITVIAVLLRRYSCQCDVVSVGLNWALHWTWMTAARNKTQSQPILVHFSHIKCYYFTFQAWKHPHWGKLLKLITVWRDRQTYFPFNGNILLTLPVHFLKIT